jgi:hypothetical protein
LDTRPLRFPPCESGEKADRAAIQQLKLEFQEQSSSDGVATVRGNLAEPKPLVHGDGGGHQGLNSIEQDTSVTTLASFVEKAGDESVSEMETAEGGTDKEALHFAAGGVEGAKSDATGGLAARIGEQDAAAGTGIFARKGGEFFVEVLEGEVEVEGAGVFEEEFAHE